MQTFRNFAPSVRLLIVPPMCLFARSSRLFRDCAIVCLLAGCTLPCKARDFTHAVVLSSPQATSTENNAIAMLRDEVRKRTLVPWSLASHGTNLELAAAILVAVRRDQIASLPAETIRQEWTRVWNETKRLNEEDRPEGFTVHTFALDNPAHTPVLMIVGNDSRGVLFGIGYVLRKIELSPNHAELRDPIDITTAPRYAIRGHQIGYRFKNNTYDAWDLSKFEQHIRDLAIFGTNSIQLIAPDSDDRPTSPLYPAAALETILGIARLTNQYGLDCDLYYPEMAKDYSDPATVEVELQKAEALFRKMLRITAFYVPGGDPGHTEPKYLFPLLEKEAVILHRYHPQAKVWVSAQGFNAAWFEEFYKLLAKKPAWLTGVFFGPQSRDSFEVQRARIPSRYPMIFYPDIAHTMHSQFPVPQWDTAYALSEGREPVNPRPQAETLIYRHYSVLHDGFITYSEGVNDDVNKFIWTQLGWSADITPIETLRDYSRFFLGPRVGRQSADAFAQALLALERNWTGPLLANRGVDTTLLQFQQLEREASSAQNGNWRFELALYRAYYDEYIRSRLLAETTQQDRALEALRGAGATGSTAAMTAASEALKLPANVPASDLRARIFELADALFKHVGIQLSVQKYGASGIERGANLDRVDVALNDRAWLAKQFSSLRTLPTEGERLAGIAAIVNWTNPGPGGFYDDLGDPDHEPHLVRGEGFPTDPEFYKSSIDGIADMTPDDGWRLSWINYAETLYEQPIEMLYRGLDPNTRYVVRITYAGEDYTLPIHLVANDSIEIHPPLNRDSDPKILQFDIPIEAVRKGTLDLKWTRPAGIGGGGRGHQIAEVWLIPQPQPPADNLDVSFEWRADDSLEGMDTPALSSVVCDCSCKHNTEHPHRFFHDVALGGEVH
jgi:hypothetical protein